MSDQAQKVDATSGATPAQVNQHTEQALIELVYIQTANNLIGGAMGNLDSALNATQSILNILQALQNLHNDITVTSKSAFPFNYKTGSILSPLLTAATTKQGTPTVFSHTTLIGGATGGITKTTTTPERVTFGPRATVFVSAGVNKQRTTQLGINADGITAYQQIYNKLASAYFGQAINPTFVFSSINAPGYASFSSELQTLKNKLRVEISVLTKQTPPSARSDPQSLLGTLRKVYTDLPSNFQFSTVEKWALDNYNQQSSLSSQAGNIENDLTTAITAAQSLNDTQKENVREFLFIFQEYYQSAAAVLSTITQVIQMMAQKISS
jgi:hypothetical protein